METNLLEPAISKARKKRSNIVCKTQYRGAGIIGSTAVEGKRSKQHVKPKKREGVGRPMELARGTT